MSYKWFNQVLIRERNNKKGNGLNKRESFEGW